MSCIQLALTLHLLISSSFLEGGLGGGDWANKAPVYEWKDEYGDVGPRFEDLEKQLFGYENHVRQGIQFDR